jgi:hypothetical protein
MNDIREIIKEAWDDIPDMAINEILGKLSPLEKQIRKEAVEGFASKLGAAYKEFNPAAGLEGWNAFEDWLSEQYLSEEQG